MSKKESSKKNKSEKVNKSVKNDNKKDLLAIDNLKDE